MNWPAPIPYSLGQCVEQLPARARQKLADLEALVSDSEALQRSLMARIKAAETKFSEIARRRDFAATARNAVVLAELNADLAAAAGQVERLRRELARRNNTRSNVEQVLSRLRNFITTLFSGMVEVPMPPNPVPVVPWQPRESEGLLDALERCRREIGGLQNELARVRSAALPAKEVKAAISAQIDRMAREGQPRLSETGTEVRVHFVDVPEVVVPGHPFYAPGSASKLLAWLHRDRIVAELCADIEDRPGAIASADRPGKMLALEGRLYGWECGEEKLVLRAMAASLDVARRPSASPWALLYATDDEEVMAVAAE